MKSEVRDVNRRLEYAQSHDLARKVMPLTLWGIAFGLLMVASLDGRTVQAKHFWAGMAVIGISMSFLAVAFYRLKVSSVPRIVLSKDGVLFNDFSEKIIPWNEIRQVGEAKVSQSRDFMSTRVTKLVVSSSFYERTARSDTLDWVVARAGDPSEIYLYYFQPPPFDEFQEAVRLRWQAFSLHATQPSSADAPAYRPAAQSTTEGKPRPSRSVVERASALASLANVAARLGKASPLQALGSVTALIAIAALATNMAGLWTTERQIAGRAEAEKWRKLRETWAAEEKASAAERKRSQENFDRMFRCMNEQFERGGHGGSKPSPECAKDGK